MSVNVTNISENCLLFYSFLRYRFYINDIRFTATLLITNVISNVVLVHILITWLALNDQMSPKGAKVYPASRRRSNTRVGLKRQLAPHCVP